MTVIGWYCNPCWYILCTCTQNCTLMKNHLNDKLFMHFPGISWSLRRDSISFGTIGCLRVSSLLSCTPIHILKSGWMNLHFGGVQGMFGILLLYNDCHWLILQSLLVHPMHLYSKLYTDEKSLEWQTFHEQIFEEGYHILWCYWLPEGVIPIKLYTHAHTEEWMNESSFWWSSRNVWDTFVV